ncbi:type II secretion system protein [Azospira inquinata]|uniref:type II secretion system protein n=1 Tax=Azospira inquinata TaxID=2785627 RepID=UPI0022B6805B|nr:type II secretion system protein [Azospira inquinata]
MGPEWFRYTSSQGKAKKGVRAVLACIVGKGSRRRTAGTGRRAGIGPGPVPSRGFTLVELITTIVIVGILAAVIGPKLSMLSVEDRGYYDRVRSTLQFAHQLAISSRRCVCVQLLQDSSLAVLQDGNNLPFDTGGSCSACGDKGVGVALPVADSHCAANVTNQVCPGAGVTLTGPASLQFDPLGRPADEKGNLVDPQIYKINRGGTWSVTVEGESGYVHGSVQ